MVKIEGTLDELRRLLSTIDNTVSVVEAKAEEVVEVAKKKRRKLNDWQRYLRDKSNHIKFKSGKRKGQLDLAKMSRAFKKLKGK